MVCGSFGSPALVPYNKGISFLNSLLAIIAFAFGVVGCVSYTNKQDAIISAPWLLSTKEVSNDVVYTASGIRSFVMYEKDDDNKIDVNEYPANSLESMPNPQTYEECQEDNNWKYLTYDLTNSFDLTQPIPVALAKRCKDCEKASVAVVTTCSFALIAAATAFMGHILRATCDSAFAKDVAFFGGGASFVFGLVSYTSFIPCAISSRDFSTLVGAEGTFGVGAKLVAASFALAAAITCLTLAVPVPEVEQKEETSNMVSKI